VSQQAPSPPDPLSPAQLRELFHRHQFRPRRSLGQTFLIDGNIARKIVAAAEFTGREPALEIGAGAGAVTGPLADAASRVVAIEIDPTLIAILRQTVGRRAHILQADVLNVDWADLLGSQDKGRWRVVANLPYAITGPALLRLTELWEWVDRLVIMVQDEVAQRLAASPGTRARGGISVRLQLLFDVARVARVARTCFWPRPRVDSAILLLKPRRPRPLPPELDSTLRRVVRAAFAARRKTLGNALAASPDLAISKHDAISLLSHCGIDHTRRAEELDETDFLRLTAAVAAREQERPA